MNSEELSERRGAFWQMLLGYKQEYHSSGARDDPALCKKFAALFASIADFECAWFARSGYEVSNVHFYESQTNEHIFNLGEIAKAVNQRLKTKMPTSEAFFGHYARMPREEQKSICEQAAANMMWRRPTEAQRRADALREKLAADVAARVSTW